MKKIPLIITLLLIALTTIGQPDPGKNGDGGGVEGDPIGGSAPIGNGTIAVSLLIIAWVAGKIVLKKGATRATEIDRP